MAQAQTKQNVEPTKATKATKGREKKTISAADRKAMDSVISDCTTTSSKIRALFAKGYEKADIARYLGKRYQHVRNVLVTPVSNATK